MTSDRIGPYEVVRELARGGMGVVVVARHPDLGREVAIKLLRSDAVQGSDVARFQIEAAALGKLSHPGIVGVHDFGDHNGHPYLVMELVDGEGLDRLLKRQGPLEPRRAAEVTLELAEAIEHAHQQGVLHRDLKPANALLDREGRVRLTDFGLAKDDQGQSLTQTGQVLGTPAYMAPEQAAGERGRFGPGTDVYGLGATLYALLTGRPPFRGETGMNLVVAVLQRPPDPLPVELDPALAAICIRCLEKLPGKRYRSAAALADDLRRYLAGELAPPAPRSPRGVIALLTVGLLVTGSLALGWGRGSRGPREPERPVLTQAERPTAQRSETLDAELDDQLARLPDDPTARYRRVLDLRAQFDQARGPARDRLEALRARDWLRRPLARIQVTKGNAEDVLGCFFPGDADRILITPFDRAELVEWRWRSDERTLWRLGAGTWLRAAWLIDETRLWAVRDGQRTIEAPSLLRGVHQARKPVGFETAVAQAEGRVRSSALSPRRRLLAVGGTGTPLRLYDAHSGKVERTLVDVREPIRYVAFSPDGSRLLATSERSDSSGEVWVFETRTGQRLFRSGVPRKCNRPAGDGSGAKVAVAHQAGFTLYDVAANERVRTQAFGPRGVDQDARDVLFLKGGYLLVSGGEVEQPKLPGRLELWAVDDLEDGGRSRPLRTRVVPTGGPPNACLGRMQLSDDRRFLLVGSLKNVIEVYEGDADPPSLEAVRAAERRRAAGR